jgi:large subunit ribosomal protein L5
MYQEKVVPALQKEFGYANVMQVPTIKKISLNVGIGKGVKEKDFVEHVEHTLTSITGQKPMRTKARKSISSFKIREGMVVGVAVTLRGRRMWDFLEKLIKVTLPRVRDFQGVKRDAFDGQGNYSLGFKDYGSFPEIEPDDVEQIHGLEITMLTSAKNNEQGMALLTQLGMPFKKATK